MGERIFILEWVRRGSFSVAFAATLATFPCYAAVADAWVEWQHQQDVPIPGAGLLKVSLPVETLDAARPDLEDLRLVDAEGNEVPYLLLKPRPRAPTLRAARSFRSSFEGQNTVLLIETGEDGLLTGILLETPAQKFIKSVRLEGSPDGRRWQLVADGIPIFREPGGASELLVECAATEWAWLRLTVNDERSDPVPFTSAQVRVAAGTAPEPKPLTVAITGRDESPGQTRLILDLNAANLTLAGIEVETDEPLFRRNITLAALQVSGDGVREHTLARGTLLHFGGNGQPEVVQRRVTVEQQIPSRELVLRIRNDDSPPLAIQAVRAWWRPMDLVFFARVSGSYRLYVGNALCESPHYDLAGLSGQLRNGTAEILETAPGPLTVNPEYRAPEALPGLAPRGAPLDVAGWKHRKPVRIEQSGAQTLELDLDVLAGAQPAFQDLRLIRDAYQLPFLIEHTSLARSIAPEVTIVDVPKQPSISRWMLKLPRANLPVSRLVCTPATSLFERRLRLFEEVTDSQGARRTRELGLATWSNTPEHRARMLELTVSQRPISDTLYLETDNGDNPPLVVANFELYHPVTRLVFKANAGDDILLYYGNPKVAAPSYDLRLVGQQLLSAPKHTAFGGTREDLAASSWTKGAPLRGVRGVLFWGVLGLVVVALLIIIARLLPKQPTNQPES